MISRLVALALRMPAIVGVLAIAILGGGLYAYKNLDIEAYPNPVAPMIEVITQPNGWSAEEVERYVTVKLETGLSGMVHLDHIRSQSLFGLSDVKCYFTWDIDYKDARQEVINRLQFITDLPPGVQPQLSPWNAIGEIFRYRVVGKGYSLTDLKTAEDWILEKQFRQVPGVIDVVGFGGYTKEYHVEVDPYQLKGQNLTLAQLTTALGNANQNVGGQRITLGEQSFNVRGIGLIRSLRDIGNVVVAETKGVPVRVRDIARVMVGYAPRLGIVGKDLEPDVVQGVVLMRYGGDSLKTIEGVHERVEYIRKNRLLPPGMDIEPYYDRAALVKLTTHTVLENLFVGMLLVTIVLWLFLGHTRAAIITAINIPLALMIAFIGMVSTGTPANLISLGAVDFGIVVDSTVIMVENIFRHLGPHGKGSMVDRIQEAAREVGPPMFTSTLIIAVAFIPLFTLTGVAGVIFSPMAHTYAFAIGGAILLALTLTPVLSSRGLSVGLDESEEHNWLMRALNRFYHPLFDFALAQKGLAVTLVLVPVVLVFASSSQMGREFMPKLEEGNFWIRATLPMSISLEESAKYVGRMRAILLGCPGATEGDVDPKKCDDARRTHPEITTVVSQLGRPDDGTDVSGFYNIELLAPLRPTSSWRRGVTKASLTEDMQRDLAKAFPGVVFNFSQVI
ncbi:MAG TPA: efflux RND transporter permease subunit, partial [Polyangia bacterium]